MGYFPYYLAIAALSYGLRYPWLLAGTVAVYALRRFIPDPWVLLRTSGRIRSLRAQVAANPANLTARRDLAELMIARLRPRAALTLVDEALRREPANAELLFLRGVALARSGNAEAALGPLVECVQHEPGLRYGEPYRVAGDALSRLGRDEEAEDAYERFVDANGSSIEGHLKLAQTRRRRSDREGAQRAHREALDTFAQLPAHHRRRQLGWWLRAQLARLYV
jgi:tetratricopeptide (TPR) repeat protein